MRTLTNKVLLDFTAHRTFEILSATLFTNNSNNNKKSHV